MKKKLFGIALIAMLAILPAAAKDNVAKDAKKEAACCAKTECRKEGAKGVNPFEGLNLTDAQKTKLADLRKSRAEQAKALKEQGKADKQKAAEGRKNFKQQYLKDVKAILTPEQYTQFLENSYVKQGHRPNFDKKCHKGTRDGKQNGQRPEKGMRKTAEQAK